MVPPQNVASLIQERLIEYPLRAESCTIDYVIDNDYALVING